MKTWHRIALVTVVAQCSILAQSNLVRPFDGVSGLISSFDRVTLAHPEDRPVVANYLVEYISTENCTTCGILTMECGPNATGCNIPTQKVQHFMAFESKEKALAFLNRELKYERTPFGGGWVFVRLLQVSEVQVNQIKETRTIPQAPLIVEATRFVEAKGAN